MSTFKASTVGASENVILNKEAKLRLNVQKGDTLCRTESPDGALCSTPDDLDSARQMALAESIMHGDREILRVLAQ